MGASLANARAGKVRGCGGLEVELEREGLIAIVKGCGNVNWNKGRFVHVLALVLSIRVH